MAENEQHLRAKLNNETAKIRWHELQRFYAQGKVLQVDPALDLVDVACQFASDNVEQCEKWQVANQVVPVSDTTALGWYDVNELLWAVVVAPWILVQQSQQD